ncbi:MAG: hypothetical protein NVS9B5_17810 [Terriglobales bacterium]
MLVYGYVVMPEHVHLLVSEPERNNLSRALQSLKQSVARTLALRAEDPFWQARYYDFNVWSEKKFTDKLRYIHRNPVHRGLVPLAEDWRWSSFCHYASAKSGRGRDRIPLDGVAKGNGWNISYRGNPAIRSYTPAQAELGTGHPF